MPCHSTLPRQTPHLPLHFTYSWNPSLQKSIADDDDDKRLKLPDVAIEERPVGLLLLVLWCPTWPRDAWPSSSRGRPRATCPTNYKQPKTTPSDFTRSATTTSPSWTPEPVIHLRRVAAQTAAEIPRTRRRGGARNWSCPVGGAALRFEWTRQEGACPKNCHLLQGAAPNPTTATNWSSLPACTHRQTATIESKPKESKIVRNLFGSCELRWCEGAREGGIRWSSAFPGPRSQVLSWGDGVGLTPGWGHRSRWGSGRLRCVWGRPWQWIFYKGWIHVHRLCCLGPLHKRDWGPVTMALTNTLIGRKGGAGPSPLEGPTE